MLLILFDGLNKLQKKLNVNDFGTEAHVTRKREKSSLLPFGVRDWYDESHWFFSSAPMLKYLVWPRMTSFHAFLRFAQSWVEKKAQRAWDFFCIYFTLFSMLIIIMWTG
jgi:hypothetical protein